LPAEKKQTVSYLMYLPEGYKEKADAKWPLMIFLHGAGERGDDLNHVKVHGPPKLVEQGKKTSVHRYLPAMPAQPTLER
jgi:predicted peptidase